MLEASSAVAWIPFGRECKPALNVERCYQSSLFVEYRELLGCRFPRYTR